MLEQNDNLGAILLEVNVGSDVVCMPDHGLSIWRRFIA
jgi:hypothetical protein